jgi:hypothetical protein
MCPSAEDQTLSELYTAQDMKKMVTLKTSRVMGSTTSLVGIRTSRFQFRGFITMAQQRCFQPLLILMIRQRILRKSGRMLLCLKALLEKRLVLCAAIDPSKGLGIFFYRAKMVFHLI